MSARRSFNDAGLLKTYSMVDGEVVGEKVVVNGLGVGFSYLEVNEKKQTIILQSSAKILGDNYLQGISINTIEQAVHEMNKIAGGKIILDVNEVIEQGRFLSLDTTNNLQVSKDVYSYLEALKAYQASSKFKMSFHNQKGNQGVVYAGSQKSFKERMILYNKYIELREKPENRDFLQTVSNPTKFLNDCKQVLRVEQNSVQIRKIRERMGVRDTSVLSVLSSPMKPNYNLLTKILKGAEQLDLFDDLDRFSKFSDFEKFKGQQTIIRECGYDLDMIESLMKHFYSEGTNYSRQRKVYRDLIYSMMEDERIEKGGVPGLVDEVLELLKAS